LVLALALATQIFQICSLSLAQHGMHCWL